MMQAAASSQFIPPRRQWHGSESDRMSTGTGVYHEDMDWTEPPAQETEWVEPNWADWASPDAHDQLEGSEGSQFNPEDLYPHDLDEVEEDDEGY